MNKKTGQKTPGNPQAEEMLPLVITSVVPQKRNSNRFSLFHEKLFLIGISGQVLLNYSIQKGVVLTPSLFKQLAETEEHQKIKESVYRYLGRRDHTSFELKQKISKKGFQAKIIDSVIQEFEQRGLLNDKNAAEKFATDKAQINNWGPGKIKMALYKKGIPQKTADKIIENVSKNLEQDKICVDLVIKRKARFLRESDLLKRKRKIFNYLSGKGFAPSVIQQAMHTISSKLNA